VNTLSHTPIGLDFLAHGNQAIDVNHASERRQAEADSRRIIASIRDAQPSTGPRHALGTLIISLGAFIAGTTANIQDRQATMPAPTPKSGYVPTR
jgi:hypothetical protein